MNDFEWKHDPTMCVIEAHVNGHMVGFVQQDNGMQTARWVMYASLPPGEDLLRGRSRSVKAAKQALRFQIGKLLATAGACAMPDAAALSS